jgi:hypothetical protein
MELLQLPRFFMSLYASTCYDLYESACRDIYGSTTAFASGRANEVIQQYLG